LLLKHTKFHEYETHGKANNSCRWTAKSYHKVRNSEPRAGSGFFFFSSPNLSGRMLDVYRTSTHDVALVRIKNAWLKCAVRSSV